MSVNKGFPAPEGEKIRAAVFAKGLLGFLRESILVPKAQVAMISIV
jgi:hypothetical protein